MDACEHKVIIRIEDEEHGRWRCEECDEHFVPAQTLVTLTQGIAAIMRGEYEEED
jgi:hypothetical protein